MAQRPWQHINPANIHKRDDIDLYYFDEGFCFKLTEAQAFLTALDQEAKALGYKSVLNFGYNHDEGVYVYLEK